MAEIKRSGTKELDNYDDLETQWFSCTIGASASNLDGTTQNWDLGDVNFDPVAENRLDRGEIAELVAFRLVDSSAEVKEQSNAGTTPGVFVIEQTVHGRPDMPAGTTLEGNKGHGDGSGNNVFRTVSFNPTYAPIHYHRDVIYTAFNDTVNGTGGGGSMDNGSNTQYINFRNEYGLGPLFDHSESLSQENWVVSRDNANQGFDYKTKYELVWDIHEYSDVMDITDK